MRHIIRKYNNEDLASVLSVWEKASQLAHSFLPEDFIAQERINLPNVYLPAADTWVTEFEGKVVGFISLIGNEVGGLFVDPAFHGIGLGRSLMNKARELHGDLVVEVFEKNTIGREFYNKYGFSLKSRYHHKDSGFEMLKLTYSRTKE